MTSNRIAQTAAFTNEMVRLEEEYDAMQARIQLGYMLVIVDEMADVCPNVASFHLDVHRGEWLTTYDAQDVDGNPVNEEMEQALDGIFLHKERNDFSRYIYQTISVQGLIDSWNRAA